MKRFLRAATIATALALATSSTQAQTGTGGITDFQQMLASERQTEVPLVSVVQTSNLQPAVAGCECCDDAVCRDRWLDVFAGGSYLDTRNDVSGGFTWGGVGGVPLGQSPWDAVASFNLNHVGDGTQSVLTLGASRVADPWSCCTVDRITALVLVDQLWDDRLSQDVYLAQMRALVGYRVSPGLELGVEYWEPFGAGADDLFLGGTAFGALRPTQAAGGYVLTRLGDTTLLGRMNYRERNDTVGLGLSGKRPLNDRLSLYAALDYEDRGTFGGSAGLMFCWGGSRRCRPCCADDGSEGRIVRGQNSSGFFSGGTLDDNSLLELLSVNSTPGFSQSSTTPAGSQGSNESQSEEDLD